MKKSTYLQALGLLTLARHHFQRVQSCERELADLLGVASEDVRYQHLSNVVWQGFPDLDQALRELGLHSPPVGDRESHEDFTIE